MKFFFNRKANPALIAKDVIIGDTLASGISDQEESENEIAAVIAIAIHLYAENLKNYENTVITIQRVIKPYSPWSSKIYGLRQTPNFIPGLRTRLK